MLVAASRLIGTPVLSVQSSGPIGTIGSPIIDPDTLKILAFHIDGPLTRRGPNILDTKSIREYSSYGCVIDSIEELVEPDDIIRVSEVLSLNFNLTGLRVETKKGSKLGHVSDYTVTSEDFIIQQIIVKRPLIKSFTDPELTISKKEIVEIDDYKIIVKDEEKTLKARSENEDFIPNFVNPFRNYDKDLTPAESEKSTE